MKLIRPLTLGATGYGLTDAMLTSSTIAEPAAGETAWVSGATYPTVGTEVIRTTTHRKYAVKVAHGGISTLPENDPTNWDDIGPTMKWAMFDKVVGTSSTSASPQTVVVTPGIINSVSLLGLVGSSVTVSMKDTPGGTTVYSRTVDLTSDEVVTDWYMYFFEPISARSFLTLTDLPPYLAGEVTVTVTGTGSVSCGTCYFGSAFELGDAQLGASVGIIDYSKKTVDADTGQITVTEGSYRDRANVTLYLPGGRVDVLKRTLTRYRATPVMWVGVDDAYEALTIFGFFKDFSVVIAYPTVSTCSLEIEGLT